MHYIVPQLYRTQWRYNVIGVCAVLSYRRGQYIDLYHPAVILGSVGNRGFVFALSLPVQPHTEWEVRRAIFCLHTEWYGSIVSDAAVSYQVILYCNWCGVMSYRRGQYIVLDAAISCPVMLYCKWCARCRIREAIILCPMLLYYRAQWYFTVSGVQYYHYDWAVHTGSDSPGSREFRSGVIFAVSKNTAEPQ